jgi:hypothetical protein
MTRVMAEAAVMADLYIIKSIIMTKNMSTTDRTIRTFIAFLLIIFYATRIVNGTIAIIALVIAGVFLLTSFFGFCPLYPLLGIHRKSKKA